MIGPREKQVFIIYLLPFPAGRIKSRRRRRAQGYFCFFPPNQIEFLRNKIKDSYITTRFLTDEQRD
jgi:hypothetical protein